MTAPLAISLPDGSHAQAIVVLPDGSHAVCVIGPDGAPCCCGDVGVVFAPCGGPSPGVFAWMTQEDAAAVLTDGDTVIRYAGGCWYRQSLGPPPFDAFIVTPAEVEATYPDCSATPCVQPAGCPPACLIVRVEGVVRTPFLESCDATQNSECSALPQYPPFTPSYRWEESRLFAGINRPFLVQRDLTQPGTVYRGVFPGVEIYHLDILRCEECEPLVSGFEWLLNTRVWVQVSVLCDLNRFSFSVSVGMGVPESDIPTIDANPGYEAAGELFQDDLYAQAAGQFEDLGAPLANLQPAPDGTAFRQPPGGGTITVTVPGECALPPVHFLAFPCDGVGEPIVVDLDDRPFFGLTCVRDGIRYRPTGQWTHDAAVAVVWEETPCVAPRTRYIARRCRNFGQANADPLEIPYTPDPSIGPGNGSIALVTRFPDPNIEARECYRITYYRPTDELWDEDRPNEVQGFLTQHNPETPCQRADTTTCGPVGGDRPEPYPNQAAPRDGRPTYRIPDDETPERVAAAARSGGCCGPPME